MKASKLIVYDWIFFLLNLITVIFFHVRKKTYYVYTNNKNKTKLVGSELTCYCQFILQIKNMKK